MRRPLYARPRFSRGLGFGKGLFHWARARVFAATTGARFVAPVWTRLSVGRWLRGRIARRHYRTQILLTDLFRRRSGNLGSVCGAVASRRAARIPELNDPRAPWSLPGESDAMAEFVGYRDFSGPVLGREVFLLAELRVITRPRWLELAGRVPEVPIVLSVRVDRDFPPPVPGTRPLRFGEATPIDWFARMLRLVRRAAASEARGYDVSGGTPDELGLLLAEPSVELVRPGCAVSDLLTLARARVLLASGSSGFSAWGAFLGGMPAASHPGQPLSSWRTPTGDSGPPRAETDPDAPDERFLAGAAEALEARGR